MGETMHIALLRFQEKALEAEHRRPGQPDLLGVGQMLQEVKNLRFRMEMRALVSDDQARRRAENLRYSFGIRDES